jgi:hypothetical protein
MNDVRSIIRTRRRAAGGRCVGPSRRTMMRRTVGGSAAQAAANPATFEAKLVRRAGG